METLTRRNEAPTRSLAPLACLDADLLRVPRRARGRTVVGDDGRGERAGKPAPRQPQGHGRYPGRERGPARRAGVRPGYGATIGPARAGDGRLARDRRRRRLPVLLHRPADRADLAGQRGRCRVRGLTVVLAVIVRGESLTSVQALGAAV